METQANAVLAVVPVRGLNTNVLVAGKEYHVQTEDLGNGKHVIVTDVFANGGAVIDHTRYDYGEHVGKENFRTKLSRALRAQHDSMIRKLNTIPIKLPESTKNELSVTHTQEIIAIESPTSGDKTSITGASAMGASATGANATGANATGANATGASATGANATGASATGASATGASAAYANATDATDVDIKIPAPAPENARTVEIAKIALVTVKAPEAPKMDIGAMPGRAHVREETLPYFVESKSTKKRMADDTWSRLVEKAKEEYDKIFNDPSTDEDLAEESSNPKQPQGEQRHHPDVSRLGAAPTERKDALPPIGQPPSAKAPKEITGGLGWDAALERARKAKEAESLGETAEAPQMIADETAGLKLFDEGLTKIGHGDVRGALVAWSRAVANDPDNKKYRANLHRLLAKMERSEGGAAKGLVLANLFS